VRRPIVLVLALLLVAAVATPADALTAQRHWRGSVGTDGKYGAHRLTAYTDGSGSLKVDLKGLRANAVYRIEVRAGRCASLGSVLFRPSSVTTGSTGKVETSRAIPSTGMNTIWKTGRGSYIAVRYYSGTSVRCGDLKFRRAMRIRIPHYGIDLPVIKAPSGYPPCGVAMWLRELYQPTEPGVTYIFGHARKGMFLPLLSASKVNSGAAMIGRTVYVYTNNAVRHKYTITQVRRHVDSIQSAFGVTSERLWIQTSEGPNSSYPKLIIVAKRVSSVSTTYAASHPKPRPYSC
jgi:hypothetical protein